MVNYDFPTNLDQYCHRVGRTGRQGEGGSAYSLITRFGSRLCSAAASLRIQGCRRRRNILMSVCLLCRNMSPMVGDLVDLLKSCGQAVEPNLEQLAADYKNGLVDLSQEDVLEDEGEQ